MHEVRARIQEIALTPVTENLAAALDRSADPNAAWPRLERWLRAGSNPASMLQALQSQSDLMESFCALLGASGYCADLLVQNPEMGSLLLDPTLAVRTPTVNGLLQEGRALLSNAHSTEHRLDRLRLLKQEWALRIAFCEIQNLWPEAQAWQSLAIVADAVIQLTLETLWDAFRSNHGGPDLCPLSVVGFGKLGGHELNYSSDIDLVFLIPDDADEALEAAATRFSTQFRKAMDTQMGRGLLYRVDLRLRPYGSRGPAVSRFSAIERYYSQYAEAWERLALIRSRMIVGDAERWERLRVRTCFGRHVTEWEVQELLAQRRRLEGLAKGNDLKRGPGGIRDVEFFAQIHQLVFGFDEPTLRVMPTLEALWALSECEVVPKEQATELAQGYLCLRKLEHFIQIEENVQSHTFPESEKATARLARCAGFSTSQALLDFLESRRTQIRGHYSQLAAGIASAGPEQKALKRAGAGAERLREWVTTLGHSDIYWEALAESESGVERCVRLVTEGERVAGEVAQSDVLVEMLISGEILESGTMPKVLSGASTRLTWLREQVAWVIAPDDLLGVTLSEVADAVLASLAEDLPLWILALGSYGTREMTASSDVDLLLLAAPGCPHESAEQAGRELLRRLNQLKLEGSPIQADLRLRPEGSQGSIVRTLEGFRAYSQRGMEMWERLALQKSRVVIGPATEVEEVKEAVWGGQLDSDSMKALLHIKTRVEHERVAAHQRSREFKLGPGGLDDLSWLCGLTALVIPEAKPRFLDENTPTRIQRLFEAGELNLLERDALLQAQAHLLALRWRLDVMGYPINLMPENPDRLEKIASAMGFDGANALIAAHQEHRATVRSIALAQLERLQSRIM